MKKPTTSKPKQRRVKLSFWEEKTGTVVLEGPEQSEVKWDTDRNHTYESNKFLIDIE